MMSSSIIIGAPPVLLLVDVSRNHAGWESAFCDRLFIAMVRRRLMLLGDSCVRVVAPDQLELHLASLARANCVLLFGQSMEAANGVDVGMLNYIAWFKANVVGPKLLVVCSWQNYDPTLPDELLKGPDDFVSIALTQQSPVTSQEAGLFFLKFFTELAIHSEDHISGRMAWFSWLKATELLKRRRLNARFSLRFRT
jgi:hypothetical protein